RASPPGLAPRGGRRGHGGLPARRGRLPDGAGAAPAEAGGAAAWPRAQEVRDRRLALVPRRHPPPQGPIAAAIEQDVVPVGPYRLPGPGRDGVMVLRDGTLTRGLWIGDEEVLGRAWAAGRAVRIRAEAGARGTREAAGAREAAALGIERMRFALGTDHDLSDFHRRFRW